MLNMGTLAGPSVDSSPDIKITAIVNNNYYLLTVILVTKPRQIFDFGSFKRFGWLSLAFDREAGGSVRLLASS